MPGFASYGAGVGSYGTNNINPPDTVQREVLGAIIQAQDPVWGGAEFVYARASASIRQYGLVGLQATFDTSLGGFRLDATELAVTANTGRAVGVALFAMTVGQFGWFTIAGNTPVNCNASVAAGAVIGASAVGQAGTNTAGRQILGASVSAAGSQTVAKTNSIAPNGSTRLTVTSADGWFPGIYLSGTGIQAGTTVVSIDPDNRTVTLSLATNAAVTGTITGTYNNGTIHYNVVTINRPYMQGAIT